MSVQINRKAKFRKVAKVLTGSLAAVALILSISAGSAWSLDRFDPASVIDGSGQAPLTSTSPSPAMADSCLPLLKSIRHTSPPSAMDRNQRSAGQAAALGLVLGVRFALGPAENPRTSRRAKARLDVWTPEESTGGSRYALAVAEYRRCQKQQALDALTDFRWKR